MGGLSDMYCKATGAEYGATKVAREAREIDELLSLGIPDEARETVLLGMLDGVKARAADTVQECRGALPEVASAMDFALNRLALTSCLLSDSDGKERIRRARDLVGEARRSAALAAGLAHVELDVRLDEMGVADGD